LYLGRIPVNLFLLNLELDNEFLPILENLFFEYLFQSEPDSYASFISFSNSFEKYLLDAIEDYKLLSDLTLDNCFFKFLFS